MNRKRLKSNVLMNYIYNNKLNALFVLLFAVSMIGLAMRHHSVQTINGLDNIFKNNIVNKIGISFLILIFTSVFIYYLYNYFKEIVLQRNNMALIFIIISINIITSFFLRDYTLFILTLSFGTILISQLFNYKIAIATNFFMYLILAILLQWNFVNLIISIISIGTAISITKETAQRNKIILCGIQIGVFSTILYTLFILAGLSSKLDYRISIIALFLGGLVSSIIALGTLPMWEKLFGILTPFRLIELSNPNQPLLKRLAIEAPGTYQHSILVGNLAEAACEAIGANSLLARVGSYYHDIGKIKRPLMFKENQFGIENPHDNLDILQSLDIILSHREDGIYLAKEYKLPNELIEFIDQHHGTTLVAFFYNKAKENDLDLPQDRFRYKGEIPKSKETAIVMLADSSEAAVRSLNDLDEERIAKTINSIVKSKLEDEQLRESQLTISELFIIEEVFINYLKGVYHQRIQYQTTLEG
jgi:hypothetical protein